MNVISYSLWGNNPKYSVGAIHNIELAKTVYPGWETWIYHDDQVPLDVVEKMNSLGAKTIKMQSRGAWDGLFWRFYPASNPLVNRMIVRDTDSRLTSREKVAVDEWIKSDKPFHGMRDHIEHNVEIMGGMWGVKGGFLTEIEKFIDIWGEYKNKGTDQNFLTKIIWPIVREHSIVHDRYYDGFIITPDGRHIKFTDLKEYNPWDHCGDEKILFYPHGKIELQTGEVFQRLNCYTYNPIILFGKHDVRPFPVHDLMEFGNCVGEIIN